MAVILNNSFDKYSAIRQQLEEISTKFIEDQNLAAELEKIEKLVVKPVSKLNLDKPNLKELDKLKSGSPHPA